MMRIPLLPRSARLSALWSAAFLAGCGGAGTGLSDLAPPGETIVSDPTPLPATMAEWSGTRPALIAADGSAYVSLPPGSVPDGNIATIRNRRSGATATALMVAGGFDPVPILASPGDTLDIDIDQFSGGPVHIVMPVPIKRPPVIVRTDPPPKKRDVPLNSVVVVVFSEPIDSTAVSAGAVGLFSGSTQVPAHVAVRDSGLRIVLQPDALLAPSSTYTLVVTSDIHDLEGDALATPFSATFTTAASANVRSQIAFHQGEGGGNTPAGIYAINPDGTGAILLVNDLNDGTGEPAWSPDGRQLAFVSRRHQMYGFPGDLAVYVINADGSGLTRLTNSPAPDEYPAWSPDGSKIAFNRFTCMNPDCTQQGYRAIYTVNVDGSGLTRLTNPVGIGDDEWPTWSPDGRQIAFARTADSTASDIFVMNADGSNVIRLTDGRYAVRSPAWSPDGRLIAYARAATNASSDLDIYIMNADGSQVRQLTGGPATDWSPSWSADGTRIVFYSEGRDPPQSLFIIGVDGSGLTRVTDDPFPLFDPNWSHASNP